MKKENRNTVIALAVVLILLVAGIVLIKNASGVNPPFTVVESNSMQHSHNESQIGIIDTGDMIMVRSYAKSDVVSYVEGYQSGHQEFGDYGSVIIYKRAAGNPVIHRAILWMDYDGTKWSAPSLENFKDENGDPLWSCASGDFSDLHGNLLLTLRNGYRDITVTLNVDELQTHSGYVTMGDNNPVLDQNSYNISKDNLVNVERIKSVAWKEIPWIGALKLMVNGNSGNLNAYAQNSVPYLAAFFITVILIVFSIGFIFDEYFVRRKTPTP